MTASGVDPGVSSRRVAIEALTRIERDDAYANLALGAALDRSGLSAIDRNFVTEMVYGTLRRRRSCDYLVDRFLTSDPPPEARSALRVGAYQLHFAQTPPHAAVSSTVGAVSKRFRGFVNAVLRKVSTSEVNWPDRGTELSYPDWLIERLVADLGESDAIAALVAMNEAPTVTSRDDGYVQDLASQEVIRSLGDLSGLVAFDLCAAPGGKATAMASAGARVVAMDRRLTRVGLMAGNVAGLESDVQVLAGDALAPPLRAGVADVVLVDAPCSGLGVLRRRPDARWRVDSAEVDRLAELQVAMLRAAAPLVAVGGRLVYSVCTLTTAETTGVVEQATPSLDGFDVIPVDVDGWRRWGSGAMVLPQDRGTDGMAMFCWRRVR